MRSPRGSSKQVYREYLAAHREQQRRERAGRDADASAGAVIPAHVEDDARKRRRSRSFWALLAGLWGQLREERAVVVASLCTLTIATLLGLAQPVWTKVAIDYAIAQEPGPSAIPSWLVSAGVPTDRVTLLWSIAGAMLTLTCFAAVLSIAGRWAMTKLAKRVQVRMRRRVFDHALRLPLHRVYQIRSGGAASILREDAGGAAELPFALIYNPWKAVVQLVGTLVILAVTDWRLLAGGLILVPVVWLSHKTWIARIRPVFRDIRASRTSIDAHATEVFGGMRVVRGFARQRGEAGRFVRHGHLMARQEIYVWWWSRAVEMIWILLIPTCTAAVLVYGGTQVIQGELTLGDVMMFSAYLLMLLSPLDVLVSTATSIQNQLAGFDRVLDLLSEPAELGAAPTTSPGAIAAPVSGARLRPSRVTGRVSLIDVGFTYSGSSRPVLSEVSLEVPAGATIALIGPSGSGKTTLCNLVARFYDPTHGRIELDGVDLKAIAVADFRRLLGIVEQEVFLFDGTVRDNIAYSRRRAPEAAIIAAAQAANAHDFVTALERGYDTVIGERGVRLSGGQKQRIAIARALLADPRILILDEATSNLDSESEALIQASLAGLMRGRTCFVIAHRLSTIRHADRIVVLEGGRIVEQGTHESLLASGGRYAGMLRRQTDHAAVDWTG